MCEFSCVIKRGIRNIIKVLIDLNSIEGIVIDVMNKFYVVLMFDLLQLFDDWLICYNNLDWWIIQCLVYEYDVNLVKIIF